MEAAGAVVVLAVASVRFRFSVLGLSLGIIMFSNFGENGKFILFYFNSVYIYIFY